jgi:hypothetical protein
MKTIIAAVLAVSSISAQAYDNPNQVGPMFINGSLNTKACAPGTFDRSAHKCLTPEQITQQQKFDEFAKSPGYEKWARPTSGKSLGQMESIPGICVGDDCHRIRKIQLWDARTGAMLN